VVKVRVGRERPARGPPHGLRASCARAHASLHAYRPFAFGQGLFASHNNFNEQRDCLISGLRAFNRSIDDADEALEQAKRLQAVAAAAVPAHPTVSTAPATAVPAIPAAPAPAADATAKTTALIDHTLDAISPRLGDHAQTQRAFLLSALEQLQVLNAAALRAKKTLGDGANSGAPDREVINSVRSSTARVEGKNEVLATRRRTG